MNITAKENDTYNILQTLRQLLLPWSVYKYQTRLSINGSYKQKLFLNGSYNEKVWEAMIEATNAKNAGVSAVFPNLTTLYDWNMI